MSTRAIRTPICFCKAVLARWMQPGFLCPTLTRLASCFAPKHGIRLPFTFREHTGSDKLGKWGIILRQNQGFNFGGVFQLPFFYGLPLWWEGHSPKFPRHFRINPLSFHKITTVWHGVFTFRLLANIRSLITSHIGKTNGARYEAN